MAVRTRAIVRLDEWNRMVTKGYQKGVYVRVTKGISRRYRGFALSRSAMAWVRNCALTLVVQIRYGQSWTSV